LSKLTELEKEIVRIAEEINRVGDLCHLVDYDPDIGQVPEHFRPNAEVLALVKQLLADTKTNAATVIKAVAEYGKRFDNPNGLPTPFSAGFSLACEEIEVRLLGERTDLPPFPRMTPEQVQQCIQEADKTSGAYQRTPWATLLVYIVEDALAKAWGITLPTTETKA
jgi:hypothetical protein